MMTHAEARKVFMQLIDSFDYIDKAQVLTQNQPMRNGQAFEPPKEGLWCRVFIRNAPTFISGLGDTPCTRTVGNLIIQCFDRIGNSTVALTDLGDAWIEHLQFKCVGHLEILQGSVIDVGEKEDFYQFNVIFEYRIN